MKNLPVDLKEQLGQWGPIMAHILYVSFWFYPTSGWTKKKYGVLWPELLGIFEGKRLTFVWEEEKMRKRSFAILKGWLLNEKNFLKLRRDYFHLLKEGERIDSEIKYLEPNNLSELGTRIYKFLTDFWIVTLVFEGANFGSPEYLKNKLAPHIKTTNIHNALETLLAPEDLSFHQQEELELLKNYVGSKSYPELLNKLNRHAKKWRWVNNSYHAITFLSGDYFLKTLKGLTRAKARQKIKDIKNLNRLAVLKKLQLIKNEGLPKNIASLSRRLAFSIWWQDERKGKLWQYLPWVYKLNQTAALLYNIKQNDLLLYTAEEWRDLLTKGEKANQSILNARKKFCVFAIGNQRSKDYTKSSIQKIIHRALQPRQKNPGNTLQGIVVSKGRSHKISGRVKILLSSKQISKISRGDILVAPMTSPDFVPAMRKAKAVITDIGGLMSHAAVVSRELGIACIVNTQSATTFLKDGDLVEININAGTVKKVKQQS